MADKEPEPVAWINAEEIGYMYVSKLNGSKDWKTNLGLVPEENDVPLYTAPQPEQWTPVEIGVDVTQEGAHVVGMYVDMPEVVRHVFYSKFHTAPTKKDWVGLTDEERKDIFKSCGVGDRGYVAAMVEAKLKEKNYG